VIGWRDHDDCVGPINEQDDGSEQPTPLEGAEKGNDREEPAGDDEARLHHVAAPIGQLHSTRRELSSSLSRAGCSAIAAPVNRPDIVSASLSGEHKPPWAFGESLNERAPTIKTGLGRPPRPKTLKLAPTSSADREVSR